MKLIVKVGTAVVVLCTAMTAMAVAAPMPPTTPFPDVPANATVCLDQKDNIERQQIMYTYAKAVYDRANRANLAGAGCPRQLSRGRVEFSPRRQVGNGEAYSAARIGGLGLKGIGLARNRRSDRDARYRGAGTRRAIYRT